LLFAFREANIETVSTLRKCFAKKHRNYFYTAIIFAGMIERLTPEQAWQEFDAWAKDAENWKDIPREGRDQIGKARVAAGRGKLGRARIASLIQKFGKGRYEYHEGEPYFTRKE
jgi:hypothetical protein